MSVNSSGSATISGMGHSVESLRLRETPFDLWREDCRGLSEQHRWDGFTRQTSVNCKPQGALFPVSVRISIGGFDSAIASG